MPVSCPADPAVPTSSPWSARRSSRGPPEGAQPSSEAEQCRHVASRRRPPSCPRARREGRPAGSRPRAAPPRGVSVHPAPMRRNTRDAVCAEAPSVSPTGVREWKGARREPPVRERVGARERARRASGHQRGDAYSSPSQPVVTERPSRRRARWRGPVDLPAAPRGSCRPARSSDRAARRSRAAAACEARARRTLL